MDCYADALNDDSVEEGIGLQRNRIRNDGVEQQADLLVEDDGE
jgi:hypothetical protein